MLKDFFLGISTFFRSIRFVRKNGLRHFYLYPILLSGILFWLSALVKDAVVDYIKEAIYNNIDTTSGEEVDVSWIENVINGTVEWFYNVLVEGKGFISGFLYWFFTVLIWIVILIINRYIVLIVLSPVFAFLSEKVEAKLTGKDYPFSFKQVMKDAFRGAFIAVKNIIIELFIVAICLIIKFYFPPASVVTVPIMWVTAWYFMGFSFIDYNHERQKLSQRQSSKVIWKRKGLSISNGMLFTLMAYIPVLGVTFGAVWATVGATLALHEKKEKQEALSSGDTESTKMLESN